MGRVSIDTRQCEIKKIFSDEFVFTIPLYQRPYSWTTEEAGMLLEDLLDAMDEGKQDLEEAPPYFLGSIVLTKGDKPDAEVIDGQQRLTTITILLAALRASIRAEKAGDLELFLYEKANAFAGTPSRYRLTLRKRDADFFQTYIQAEHGMRDLIALPPMALSESQRNIRDNALAYIQRLQHLSEGERINLGKFLVNNCFVVVVSTADFDTAYRIFSVLNDRGRNLSYADILKAQIIGDIPIEEQEEYTNKWEEIEVLLGNENFQNLLLLIRILSASTRVRKNLLEEFQTYVYPTTQRRMTAQQLIDHLLHPYGYILHTMNTADCKGVPHAPEIEELLRWLNRLPHKEWVPAALQYWGRNKNKLDQVLHFLKDLDRLSVGLLLLNMSYNKRSERYRQLQQAIKQGMNVYTSVSPLQLTDEEQHDIYKALNGNVYVNINSSLCKYILLRLDTLISDGSASYDFPTISVEHVLPQKPAPNSEWTRVFPGDLQNRWVHRLGNLVLLSRQKNRDANNYDFARKKEIYFSNRLGVSPFVVTSQVINTREWTPEIVQRRQQDLVSRLASHWNLKGPSLHVIKGA
ncbi:MAG: DUF262 domain-containing protein [Ktedonobacteraceae bacterium]|nr:DUF262 domain-containing protein [Ktedonobacteraceae bacterium]